MRVGRKVESILKWKIVSQKTRAPRRVTPRRVISSGAILAVQRVAATLDRSSAVRLGARRPTRATAAADSVPPLLPPSPPFFPLLSLELLRRLITARDAPARWAAAALLPLAHWLGPSCLMHDGAHFSLVPRHAFLNSALAYLGSAHCSITTWSLQHVRDYI